VKRMSNMITTCVEADEFAGLNQVAIRERCSRGQVVRRFIRRGLEAEGIIRARPSDEQLDPTAGHKSGGEHVEDRKSVG